MIRDIVFLIDGSDNVGNANLPAVRNFISAIVNKLDVRPERVRIGLVQFAEQPKHEFFLNYYTTKQDVLNAISQLRLMGGRALNAGAALQYAFENYFRPSAGSRIREKVQQVLIVLTADSSQDNVKHPADTIASAEILSLAVGVGRAEQQDLLKIAYVPSLAYYERSFADLPRVVDEMMTPLVSFVTETGEIQII